jgi:hypothetical protein
MDLEMRNDARLVVHMPGEWWEGRGRSLQQWEEVELKGEREIREGGVGEREIRQEVHGQK